MGIAILAVALFRALQVSWRKWPDPLIDFGRELYLPWRLSEGAVLYRDMDANYGPLSHYFNALIFRIAGPGMMHLVVVNLAVYAAILGLLYYEIRMGWGRLAAFACCLVFIVAFSFSQFVGIGNYNFATPYAHETTHGFLLILMLVGLLASWLRRPAVWKAAAAGVVCGLCVLLKVEILFTAAVVVLGAVARAAVTNPSMRRPAAWLATAGLFVAGGLLPPLVATAVLWKTGGFSPLEAFSWANSGWLGLFIYKNIAQDPIQAKFLGIQNAAANLGNILLWGGLSAAAAWGACACCRDFRRWKIVIGACLFAGAMLLASKIPWLEIGRALPVWLCLAAFLAFRPGVSARPEAGPAAIRWLLLLAAAAFLARMALNPRIYHYGYCQAALAGVVAIATAFRTLPDRFALAGKSRAAYLVVLALFLGAGLWNLDKTSAWIFALKRQPVGVGPDRFYGFDYRVQPSAAPLEEARSILAAKTDCRTLLVVPEGIMLNYLLRKPSPTHVYTFNPFWLNWRDSVLADLRRHPPDYAVLISRDMREYGINRFGESPEHGSTLISWLDWNYAPEKRIGGDPLDPDQQGLVILKKLRK